MSGPLCAVRAARGSFPLSRRPKLLNQSKRCEGVALARRLFVMHEQSDQRRALHQLQHKLTFISRVPRDEFVDGGGEVFGGKIRAPPDFEGDILRNIIRPFLGWC